MLQIDYRLAGADATKGVSSSHRSCDFVDFVPPCMVLSPLLHVASSQSHRKEQPMKITEVLAHPLSVPYAQPRWTAHERMERDQVVLVEVRTDQGLVGYGEIAGGPQKLICDLVRTFAAVVTGMDPLGHVEIWQLLFSL